MANAFTPLRRITVPTLAVLAVLLRDDQRWFGLRIAEETQLRTATIYPILGRLESAGWATADWEVPGEDSSSGVPRKYYTLTEQGRESASVALQRREETIARQQRSASLISRDATGVVDQQSDLT
jgi:DNA-binding PadR family transcriptional regulator